MRRLLSFTKNAWHTRRFYHDRVLDHYKNPRNVGSLDQKDENVGTGLVGSPACIHGNTFIATADGTRYMKIKDIYDKGSNMPVWSYNIQKQKYEIKLARAIKNPPKKMVKIVFDDNSFLMCTKDHKVLSRVLKEYVECTEMNNKSVVPFKRSTTKKGYWEIRNSEKRFENNNPYFSFTDEQKKKFASHKGSSNGRWINVENDSLLKIGKKIMDKNGKLTKKLWQDYATIIIIK